MAVVTQFLVAVAVLAALRSLASADRCSEICSQENFSDQCGTCLGRAPVRFGKRSPPREPELTVNRRLLADLPPAALLSLLLQTAVQLQTVTRPHPCDYPSAPPCTPHHLD